MILTAHQPTYLPWLGLFHKIARADTFVLVDTVQYLPRDWNNRNKIKCVAGPHWLTVPVLKKGHRDKPLKDIEINNDIPWQRKHSRSIWYNYQKAPYFKDVWQSIWPYYDPDLPMFKLLSPYCEGMLMDFCSALDIKCQFLRASDFEFQGKKSDLVLDMCKQLGATKYIFGALGRDYAKLEDFENIGCEVEFQHYKHPVYPQLHGDFVPRLSVIDLLMNCGPRSREFLCGS